MSSTKKGGFKHSWSISFAILLTFCLAGLALGQTTFPGAGTGPIPDRGAAGCGLPAGPNLDITFTVTGMPAGAPSNVNVDITATHTWVGDIDARLIAPNATEHVLFSSTGSTTAAGCGSADDLGGTYVFDNSGTGDWWALGSPYPAGTYQTTTAGDVPTGGDTTDMNAAFAAIPDMNGTWTLRVNDSGGGDTGAISAANLTLTGGVAPPAGQKFVDFDGDGKADYSLARDVTPSLREGTSNSPMLKATSHRERLQIMKDNPLPTDSAAPADHGTNIGWYIANSTANTHTFNAVGQPATDFITPNDFDGDGQADIAVWRGAASPEVAFYILESTTSTIREDIFGQTNDNPAIVADYDGDGTDDVAVLRCPSTAGQCTFFYRGSAGGGETTYIPWGFGTFFSIFPNTGDFDGDGKADFNVQRTNPAVAGAGQFVLLRSSDFGVEYVNWGANTDLVIPGDYNGDGRSDYAVGRLQGGERNWYILSADNSTVLNYATVFGLTGDFPTAADYDGDGKTDISVWRPEPGGTTNNFFYVLKSSDSSLETYGYGIAGDYPPANSKVQ